MVRTSLVIPCYWLDWDLIDMTQECIDSLRLEWPDEVIVVNDGSPEKDIDLGWQGITQINRRKNGGFAKAVNTGLKKAKGQILIIANNDIIFTPGWLTGLLKPLKLGYDISSICTSDQGWETKDEITEDDKFGSLWAMKRKVYEKLGGLDERFGRGTFEDLDYRRRALDAGFRIAKYHGVLVEHLGRATFDRVDPDRHFFTQNREKYRAKHGFVE